MRKPTSAPGRPGFIAVAPQLIRLSSAQVKKSEACVQGAFVGPELMDILFRRFEPEGITKEDIARLSKINDHHSPFDFA